MDKTIANLIKRETERQLDIQKKKNEKKLLNSENEQFNNFKETFQNQIKEIENWLNVAATIDKKEIAYHFDKIFREIHNLQKYVTDCTIFLRGYDMRVCQQSLANIELKARTLEDELIPKKKFGFKNKRIAKKAEESVHVDVIDNVTKSINFENTMFGFKNEKNATLTLFRDDLYKKDVTLNNLENCIIKLHGAPTTLHITSITNCTILCGPVSTSVFVENCQGSKLVIACQQLRLHSSQNCDIYLHVTSRGIIEDCNNIRVAPYNYAYPSIEDDFQAARLDRSVNHWNDVHDFNWLVADKHSPNWMLLNELNDWSDL